MRPGKLRALDKANAKDVLIDNLEKIKATIRAKVEHSFRVIKRQFGHLKTRYRWKPAREIIRCEGEPLEPSWRPMHLPCGECG